MKNLIIFSIAFLMTLNCLGQQPTQYINHEDFDTVINVAGNNLFVYFLKDYPKDYKRQRPQFGIRAGLNSSWFALGDPHYTGINKTYVSVVPGLYGNIPLGKCTKIRLELLYIQRGSKNPDELNFNGDRRTFKTTYIELPVTIAQHFGSFNFQLGGYAAKLIRATNYDFYTPGLNFSWHVKHWDWYQSYDWGFVGGLGVNLHPINLEAHYRHGMFNVRRKSYNDPRANHNHNATLDLSLYIPFSTFK